MRQRNEPEKEDNETNLSLFFLLSLLCDPDLLHIVQVGRVPTLLR
jgi:hypothetical protein